MSADLVTSAASSQGELKECLMLRVRVGGGVCTAKQYCHDTVLLYYYKTMAAIYYMMAYYHLAARVHTRTQGNGKFTIA